MAADSLLRFLCLCCFLLPLSVACPEFFECGDIGKLYFPFTTTNNTECGLLPVMGCDDPDKGKLVQLGARTWWDYKFGDRGEFQIEKILYKDLDYQIMARGSELEKLFLDDQCKVMYTEGEAPIPPESLTLFFSFSNAINLLRCEHLLDNNTYKVFNYDSPYHCNLEHLYYTPDEGIQWPDSSSECSLVHLPFEQQPPNTSTLATISEEIFIQVHLSQSCIDCLYYRKGQCLPDGKCTKDGVKKIDSRSIAIGLANGTAGIIVIILFIIVLVKVRRFNCSGFLNQSRTVYFDIRPSTTSECVTVDVGVSIFSYEELEEATNNFDQSQVLGRGGCGTVYYGKLGDGKEVAVKRLHDHKHHSKRVKQFMNEIQAFTRLRHKNLVSLYGCTSPQSRGLLLAYEYIPNGTVASHLHGDLAKPGSLPWPRRMKIAKETATALTYLHASDIIHRDVKTCNILLDSNFCVKVADFGISRLFSNDVSHVSTAPLGTMGYIDPEYLESHQLTYKSDVYSFGVVLIELISSLPAVDQTRKEDEIKLANLAIQKVQRREFTEVVDPTLGFESDNEYKRMIISVAELAFQCLQREKELRPSMYKVLDELQKIASNKDKLEPLEIQEADI
ncbi:LEAF RUST 10 DISEASE-RESISTANCE LOCUS RECEPTOR-LIKE PROTEIN KINASE-like 1.2 [Prosopis cineraria]|uniref:LEAF RUST 10 DISEASE-RESISTANCE LOCUS RECEPTOR-LIKE PROTEIN KINASE-like 1.2 n=1 Tax=Prosopis cineraria TaxID=364024 RepID=UPI00240FC605|nr:LEAF RUST 10 DISEASE-RESISTANCE LOCUS RECEPTOR-LIKE PROTEIN KINASE-like 1.2 [Prosopis cineraria]